jgi:Dolichyl-phosphate-mannose-protein mannosyltransferase
MALKLSLSRMFCAGSNQNRRECWLEIAGLVALAGLTALYLSISWRKWCDPLIDFGDQLYTAWRLSEGAVLYRDVDLLYGPLSQYFNAAIFRLFGPGIMVLVTANVVIFAAILTLLYLLCRGAWGRIAAFAACALFIAVFGFSQFVHFGNLNYVTPYSHETTHGVLICLLLCWILVRWIDDPTPVRTLLAGACFGLSALLKPEIMFAAGVTTGVACLTSWHHRGLPRVTTLSLWIIGATFPTVVFALCFSTVMSGTSAVGAATHGWINVTNLSFSFDVLQRGFLGFDRPWQHLAEQVAATLLALLLIGALAAIARISEKFSPKSSLWLVVACVAITCGWFSFVEIKWIEVGRCLLGLISIYAVIAVASILREKQKQNFQFHVSRVLLAALAIALMARMILNGRIYHYGYYQAALAAVILAAILIAEVPIWLGVTWRGRAVLLTGIIGLLLPGVVRLTKQSLNEFRWKTISIGSGRDQFYVFAPELDPEGEMVGAITGALRKGRQDSTLLVLPEGEMINYLARLRNPIPQFFFYDGVTENGGEQQIVNELETRPPYWVVLISRDLGEYGVDRYGAQAGNGREILSWIERNYKRVAAIGGDPLDYREHGAVLLRKY